MTDDRAEQAFRDTLHQHADDAGFQPLHMAARSTPRWTRWLPAAAAFVLVAAIAVPLLIGRLNGTAGSSAVPAQAPVASASAGSGSSAAWRWESSRVLSYQVPVSWGYGWSPAGDWCAAGTGSPYGAFVDVAPEQRTTLAIGCSRTIPADRLAMFVTVRPVHAADRGWDVPQGWRITETEIAGYLLEVVHPEREQQVAREIVGTARPIGAVDPNGCQGIGGSLQQQTVTDPLRVSLCQYDLAKGRQLLASKQLTGSAARQVAQALASAPDGTGPDDDSCTRAGDAEVVVRLWEGQAAQDVRVRYSGCRGNGIEGLGAPRKVTFDACQAIMQGALTFNSGHGAAAQLCAPPPTPSAVPSPSTTR